MIDKKVAAKNGIRVIESEGKNALLECLKANFPQTIKEGQADLNAIATLLGLNANLANKAHYELTFTGKGLANALYDSLCEKVLKFKETFCVMQNLSETAQKSAKNSQNAENQKSPANSATPSLRGDKVAEAIQKSPSLAEGDLGGGF